MDSPLAVCFHSSDSRIHAFDVSSRHSSVAIRSDEHGDTRLGVGVTIRQLSKRNRLCLNIIDNVTVSGVVDLAPNL